MWQNPTYLTCCLKHKLILDNFTQLFICVCSGSSEPTHSVVQESDDLQDVLDDGLDALLDEYDALDRGFKRKERLDVKKPGPFFSTNNYAFQHTSASEGHGIKQVSVVQND
jgi:hypothetical protein